MLAVFLGYLYHIAIDLYESSLSFHIGPYMPEISHKAIDKYCSLIVVIWTIIPIMLSEKPQLVRIFTRLGISKYGKCMVTLDMMIFRKRSAKVLYYRFRPFFLLANEWLPSSIGLWSSRQRDTLRYAYVVDYPIGIRAAIV